MSVDDSESGARCARCSGQWQPRGERESEGGRPPGGSAEAVEAWTARHQDRLAPGEAGGETLSGLRSRPSTRRWTLPAPPEATCAGSGFPGEPPFTRGVLPGHVPGEAYGSWASTRGWRARPRPTCASARLLAQGQRGFSVALDLPTQNGLDSDHPLAQGEVGRVGVPIDTLADMETHVRRHPARPGGTDPHDGQRHRSDRSRALHRRRRVARVTRQTASGSCSRTTC